MAELRWILLIVGLVFLAALAAWELRRPRQAQRRRERCDDRRAVSRSSAVRRSRARRARTGDARAGVSCRQREGRRPVMRAAAHRSAGDRGHARRSMLADADALQRSSSGPTARRDRRRGRMTRGQRRAAAGRSRARSAPTQRPVAVRGCAEPRTAAAAAIAAAATAARRAPLVVDWPPEGERHIVALRIVAAASERLSGRAVRLALAACGFVHGRFGIFHQPDEDGRALLSAASLSKPGILDPVNMDFQRFAGLSVCSRCCPGRCRRRRRSITCSTPRASCRSGCAARCRMSTGSRSTPARLEDLRDRMQSLHPQRGVAGGAGRVTAAARRRIAELREQIASTTTATTCSTIRRCRTPSTTG